MNEDLYGVAKYYIELNFSPFPVKEDKSPDLELLTHTSTVDEEGKVSWAVLRKRKPTEEELKAWFNGKKRPYGIAVVPPPNVVVLDIDEKELWNLVFDKEPEEIANRTVVHETPNGYHVFFKVSEGTIKKEIIVSFEGNHRGVELKPSSFYVVAPPTKGYNNLSSSLQTIEELDKEKAEKFINLLKFYFQHSKFISIVSKVWKEGIRHNLAGPLAGFLRKRGLSKEETEAIMKAVYVLSGDDEEMDRKRYVEDTYNKPIDEVAGASKLKDILAPLLSKEELDFVLSSPRTLENKEKEKKKDELVFLSSLNMIEDPKYIGRNIVVEGIVCSTSIAYAVPKKVTLVQTGDEPSILEKSIDADGEVNLKLVGVKDYEKYNTLKRYFGSQENVNISINESRTVYLVKVRPPVFTLEKRNGKIVDEKGFEYKSYEVFIVSDRQLNLKPSTLLRLEAKPLASPKSQKIVLLASKVEFPEEDSNFNIEKIRKLKAKLDSLGSVKEKVRWVLEEFEKFSHIRKRRNLAFTGFLTFFSPMYVEFDGESNRGWVLSQILGDTTTGKSETILKLITLLNAGVLVTAETASQVGLTGTTTQIEKVGWLIDWGFLVLCDKKLLAIDGAHKLPPSAWAGLAESERSGVITITKAAKDSAYARTRQIKISNAIDRKADKWKTKPLNEFLYPCLALPTVLDEVSIARLDIVAFSDSSDVRPEDVNVITDEHYAPELEFFSEAIKWCWSGKVKIEFEKDAVEEILKSSSELYHDFYVEEIPIVNMETKFKLARLSASLATLTLSTDDFVTVKVTAEHVKEVVEFIRSEYSKAGLNALAKERKYESYTKEEAEELLHSISEKTEIEKETLESIIKFIVVQGRVTRDQLWKQFNLSENSQLRPLLAQLQNEKLIEVGKGFYSTSKLIKLYKVLEISRLSSLSRSERNPPLPSSNEVQRSEIGTPSFLRIDKVDNFDKNKQQIEPKNDLKQRSVENYLKNVICEECKFFDRSTFRCTIKGVTVSPNFKACQHFELRESLRKLLYGD